MPSKPTAKDAMTYMLDPDNPRTKFHGNFERFISGTRWYKSSTVIMVKDKGKDDSEICELKFKHHTPYKTSLREYGHQLQQIINELIDDKIYYPEASHSRVWVGEPPTVAKLEPVVEEGNDFYSNLIDFLLRDKTYQLKKINGTYYSVKTPDGRCAIALKLSDEKPYNGKVKVELVTFPALVQRYALALKPNKVLSIADKKNIPTESESQISIPLYKAFVDYLNKHFHELKENKE